MGKTMLACLILLAGCGNGISEIRASLDTTGAGLLKECELWVDTGAIQSRVDALRAGHCAGMISGVMALHFGIPRQARIFCPPPSTISDNIVALQNFAKSEPRSLGEGWNEFIIEGFRVMYPCKEETR